MAPVVTVTGCARGTVEPVRRERTSGDPPDPWAVLGIAPGSTADEIQEARRRLAKSAHPDLGGSVAAMQQVNRAAELALAAGTAGSSPRRPAPAPRKERRRPEAGGVRHDHPSFTIEALPAEAFEGLLIAASTLGEIADDDPPYVLEVVMATRSTRGADSNSSPMRGAATVSITTARLPGHPTPDLFEVRDVWIDALNRARLDEPGVAAAALSTRSRIA